MTSVQPTAAAPSVPHASTTTCSNATSNSTSINALWNVWNDHACIQIPNTSFTLKGFSVAALRTNFYIPELDIMLDAGISSNYNPTHIFITHSHTDHCANIPLSLYTNRKNEKIQVYIPKPSAEKLIHYIKSLNSLSSEEVENDGSFALQYFDTVPVTNETFEITVKGRKLQVQVVPCYHSVPCVGYGFSEKRMKLKPEYKDLPGKEIALLRKQNVDINNEIKQWLFVFLGDTDQEVLETKDLEKYPTIMIECTFLLEEELEQARKTKHMHWNHLKVYVAAHPSNHFILYHFSQRYKKSFVEEFFQKLNLSNVSAWTN